MILSGHGLYIVRLCKYFRYRFAALSIHIPSLFWRFFCFFLYLSLRQLVVHFSKQPAQKFTVV